MPTSAIYGSTGRPPGEFHLRHSLENSTNNLEFLQHPFDIFSTEFANNNNNNDIGYYNGGIETPISLSAYDDNKEADTAHSIHRTDKTKWFDLIFNKKNNNNNNINSNNNISNTNKAIHCHDNDVIITPINYNTSTYDDNKEADTAHSIHRTDKTKWFDLIFNKNNNITSNNNNNLCSDNGNILEEDSIPVGHDSDSDDINTNVNDGLGLTKWSLASNENNRRITVTSNDNNNNNNNNTTDTSSSDTTDAPTTIHYNTSTCDDNNKASIAHRIHRTDEIIEWFDSIFYNNIITTNNNNRYIISNNNKDGINCCEGVQEDSKAGAAVGVDVDIDVDVVFHTNVVLTSNNHIKLLFDNNNNNNTTNTTKFDTTTINYNTSTYDDNNKANIAHRIHRTDKTIEWFDSISNINNNNNNNIEITTTTTSNNDATSTTTDTTDATPTINYNTSTYDSKIFHVPLIFQLTPLYLILTKSTSPKEFKTAKEKQQQQQQQHYHCKQRHQFHLEQQQKHQLFKQDHNVERMVTSIVLKLTLVAWDIWAFRNVY